MLTAYNNNDDDEDGDHSGMIFSKLVFDTPPQGNGQRRSGKDFRKNNSKDQKKSLLPSNPKQALEIIQMRKQKIEKLATKEEKELSQRHDAWAKAFKRSQGIAVRDDVSKLKRAINKKEKIKEKKRKLWTERASKTKDDVSKKALKRQENIDSRRQLLKETRMTKRMGISKKSLVAKRAKEQKSKKTSSSSVSQNKKMGSSGRHYKMGSGERRQKKENSAVSAASTADKTKSSTTTANRNRKKK